MAGNHSLNLNSPERWATYGNNYFILSTNLGEGVGIVNMDGLMTDLPSVGIGSEWENTPAATIGEKLDQYLNNDMLQFLATVNEANDGGKMVAMDCMTSRMYKNCSPPKFDLKFRVYPGQKIGPYPMRSAKEWEMFLALTTPVNSNCGFSLANVIGQVKGAAEGAKNFFKALADGKDKDGKDDDDKTKEDREKKRLAAHDAQRKADQESGGNKIDKGSKNDNWTNDENVKKQQQDFEEKMMKYQTNAEEGGMGSQNRTNGDKQGSVYGANLFNLTIYPFIYSQPLVVYIDSWSVTPSREWNTDVDDHYYYDFTISCQMDQILSAKSWCAIIVPNNLS